MLAAITRLGAATMALGAYAIDIAALMVIAPIKAFTLPPVAREVLAKQIYFTGVQAIPFVGLLALLTALVVVVQAGLQAAGVGDAAMLGRALVVILVRESGPLVVALAVVARSGTAIAAELAGMVAAREIETMELMGVRPLDYLVVPRLVGMGIATACLTLLFIAASLTSGFVLSLLLVPGAPGLERFIALTAANIQPVDILVVLGKTLVPGLVIAAIACREGLTCKPVHTEVPRATARAMVRSIATVFLWNAALTALIYAAG